MATNALKALSPHFFQVAYIVRDIEEAEAWFEGVMGVPKFTRLANIKMKEGCEFRGRPADYEAHLSLGYLRDVQLELIEHVRGESLYQEFLDQKGPGLHHVAFSVPDFDSTIGSLVEAKLDMFARGKIGEGTQFAYFDCEGPGYSVVEILGFDEATTGFMEHLRKESADLVAAG